MKVVLFCGGQGMRLRGFSDRIPKPLVDVGPRPIIWHLMKYYAHYGHKDFILCLGYGAQHIKQYFLEYDEYATNDFILSEGGRKIEPLATDIDDWRITFVDTGLSSNVGERLRRIRRHVGDDEMFMANYADGLTDLPLDRYLDDFIKAGSMACFMSVPPPHTFHLVHTDSENHVKGLQLIADSDIRMNAGFFILRSEIFDYMFPDEELVAQPFDRLIEKQELLAVPYDGFFQNMDTFKDKLKLDEMAAADDPAWHVWNGPTGESTDRATQPAAT